MYKTYKNLALERFNNLNKSLRIPLKTPYIRHSELATRPAFFVELEPAAENIKILKPHGETVRKTG